LWHRYSRATEVKVAQFDFRREPERGRFFCKYFSPPCFFLAPFSGTMLFQWADLKTISSNPGVRAAGRGHGRFVKCMIAALATLLLCQQHAAAQTQNINPGVPWPATDGLGRSLPLAGDVAAPRSDRFIGMFYFLCLGRHGNEGPFDITKILTQDPSAATNKNNPLWGPPYSMHHWGEPLFDYYLSEDPFVLRKHAQMLADAGVDVILFDVSNQFTYPDSWGPLCQVFEEVRKAGGRTPQIAFLCPFWEPRKAVRELYEQLYSRNLHTNLWFRWEGKPLILADPALIHNAVGSGSHGAPKAIDPGHTLGQSFTLETECSEVGAEMPTWHSKTAAVTLTLFGKGPGGDKIASHRFTGVEDNGWVVLKLDKPLPPGTYYLEASAPESTIGWWDAPHGSKQKGHAFADGQPVPGTRNLRMAINDPEDEAILKTFTFRKPQPDYFCGPTGPNQWSWLEVTPQHIFTNTAGQPEQMSVGISQNALQGHLSAASNPHSHGRSFHDGTEPGPEGQDYTGRNFQDQWKRALNVDPPFIFVTGWNEWTALRMDESAPFYGSGPVTFVDEFNKEFSRDIEPTRGGHEDAYYYQFISYVRRYKGVPAIPTVKPAPISMDGQFQDWTSVTPEFLDTPEDPVRRDHPSWNLKSRLVNQSGRNDILASKVSADAQNIYLYVKTREALTPPTGSNWMLLYIDADSNPKTGWLGYDYVINRINVTANTTTLEKNTGGYHWDKPAQIPLRITGNELELAIPRTALGLTQLPIQFDFKWADNIRQTGEASDFTENGDCAPNDRFNFRARIDAL
jgi:hypothetical protein